jgi:signal transduction histidine kinase
VEALRERVAQYALNDVRVTIEAPEALPPLPAAVEVAAYRIALEALANVVKHAHATTCAIRIALAPEALTLETRDDGVGRGDSPLGVGLIAMRERATELGGSLVVEDAEPHGTRVRARFPLRMA